MIHDILRIDWWICPFFFANLNIAKSTKANNQ